MEDQVLEAQEAQTEAEISTSAETSAETPADNGEKHDIRIPKARFDEVNEQRKQLLAKLQALEAAGAAGLSVRALLSGAPADRCAYLETALVWLAKQGLVDWLAD